jgi:hypothetical protein
MEPVYFAISIAAISIAAAYAVVFLCLFCYRLGIKDGRAIKDNKPLEKAVNIPTPEKKKPDEETDLEKQFLEWAGFQPKYTETRQL